MENLDLKSALASCTWYPVQIDIGRRLIWFAEVERQTYRRAGFMVPKQAPMSEGRYGFNLDDVLLHDLNLPIGGAPSHYIFISAFCCSTLLARLLDRVPNGLVLKEPSVLGQLGMLRYRPGTPAAMAEREEDWRTWGELGIRLLTRLVLPRRSMMNRTIASGSGGSIPMASIVSRNNWNKLDYAHHNPVTRELVGLPSEGPWSSWRSYFLNHTSLLAMGPII